MINWSDFRNSVASGSVAWPWSPPCSLAVSLSAQRAERAALDITGYVIDAEIDTATHHLAAKAQVTFTAPENADEVSFGFHPALKVTKITDDTGKLLTGERLADGTIRVTPAAPFANGQANHWTFEYDGVITGNEDGPVEGLKLAAIQEPITYLLYPARWFPTTGYLTDRFTAEMHIRVPQGMKVFASGAQGDVPIRHARQRQAGRRVRLQLGQTRLPRHRHRRPLSSARSPPAPATSRSTSPSATRPPATSSPQTAAKEYDFFTDSFGAPETPHLNVVELPDDTLPAVWAPELAAIMGSRVGDKSGIRLLANTIAHQWWGSEVSPRTLNDAWITNGMARYGELMYRRRRKRQERPAHRPRRTSPPALSPTTPFLSRASAA